MKMNETVDGVLGCRVVLLETLIDLPILVPHSVVGIAGNSLTRRDSSGTSSKSSSL